MPEAKRYEVDGLAFEFSPNGSPFKGLLIAVLPEDRAFSADVNLSSIQSRAVWAGAASEQSGMDTPRIKRALNEICTLRTEEVARAAEAESAEEERPEAKPDSHKPPDCAELLAKIAEFIRRFVALSEEQACLCALWIVHTHAFTAADTTPYLNIKSAEKRSGKTRLLEALALLVAGSWLTGRVTPAVLVRKVAAEAPTLLLDESDAAFKGDREYAETLRGVLNAGFRRGGAASLCVGQGAGITYEDFPVFSPKAIAGIGKLPDTVADRSIPIELRRRKASERVERFRLRKVGPEALPIRQDIAAWAVAHLDALTAAEPVLPDELDDRAQDIMEPLFAIADVAGGEWPDRARAAAVTLLAGEEREDSESLGVRLLREIRDIFDSERADRFPTAGILKALCKIEEAPWGSLRGEPLDARGLARLLKPFGVKPEKLREGEETFRGYRRVSFEDAWARYVPDIPEEAEHVEQPEQKNENPRGNAKSSVPHNVPHDRDVPAHEIHAEHENPHGKGDVPRVPHVPHNPAPNPGTEKCNHDVPGGCWLCKKHHPDEWGAS